jgi:hypothetical protein
VGLVVEYGRFRALLTGDSEVYELHYWLTHNEVPRVQVVKVAHHGSSNGTTTEWVQATRPDVAVISVGAVNSYGHPSPSVIGQWQSVGARIRRTDVEGTIVILADSDGTFNVTTERSDGPTIPRTIPQNSDVKAKASDSVVEGCCKVCSRGKACGNSCISLSYVCRQPPGCACDARP